MSAGSETPYVRALGFTRASTRTCGAGPTERAAATVRSFSAPARPQSKASGVSGLAPAKVVDVEGPCEPIGQLDWIDEVQESTRKSPATPREEGWHYGVEANRGT